MQATKKVILAVVTQTEDVSLQCTTSLLRLQQAAARRPDVHLDIHIVSTLLEALNINPSDNQWLVIVDGTCGVPDAFVFQAIAADKDMVLGIYPLPRVDWDRISAYLSAKSNEPVEHTGNVYNIKPRNVLYSRYVAVDTVNDAKIMCISLAALKSLSGPHTAGNNMHLYTHDAIFGGRFYTPYQTLVKKFQDTNLSVVADVENQCTISGNAQFAGCVGARGFVR